MGSLNLIFTNFDLLDLFFFLVLIGLKALIGVPVKSVVP